MSSVDTTDFIRVESQFLAGFTAIKVEAETPRD